MKFPAKHFEPADVIAVLMGEEDAIELGRGDSALFETDHDLPRAQPAINQNPAMIGRDESAISGGAAAEHGQGEHRPISSGPSGFSQIGNDFSGAKMLACHAWLPLQGATMMKSFLCTLAMLVAFGQMTAVRASEETHRQAAEALLGLMDMDKLMSESIDQMLEMQVKQNPAIGQFKDEMKKFLSKYMSWAAMKDDMVKIYASEFTEQELKELLAFYQTPLGKKTVQKMPKLMAKGAELGQQRVQQHLPELQQSIQESATKKTP